MNWFSLAGSCLLLLSFSLSADETIRLTSGEWPPYLSEKLPHFGFASHLVSEAYAAVDVNVEYGFFPWKRSFLYAKKGAQTADVWHGSVVWVYTEERAEDFLYTDVAITEIEVLFHLKTSPLVWKDVNDLKGMVIGGTLHTVYPTFEKADKDGILTIERQGNYNVLFSRLLKKRVDAVPQVRNVGNYFLRTNLTPEEQAKIAYSPTVIQERKYHVILTKQHEENKRFVRLFNQGLQIIKNNGVYDRLFNAMNQGHYDNPTK